MISSRLSGLLTQRGAPTWCSLLPDDFQLVARLILPEEDCDRVLLVVDIDNAEDGGDRGLSASVRELTKTPSALTVPSLLASKDLLLRPGRSRFRLLFLLWPNVKIAILLFWFVPTQCLFSAFAICDDDFLEIYFIMIRNRRVWDRTNHRGFILDRAWNNEEKATSACSTPALSNKKYTLRTCGLSLMADDITILISPICSQENVLMSVITHGFWTLEIREERQNIFMSTPA